MLVSCNPGCLKNGGTTDASLSLKNNKVICNICGDTINNISTFSKISMKNNGDTIKEAKRAFTFECSYCNERCEVEVLNHKSVGKNCQTKDSCMFNITTAMKHAVAVNDNKNKNPGSEEGDEAEKGRV